MSETIVYIKLNWVMQVKVAAAYCYQLEYQSSKVPVQQIAEVYDLIPSERFFVRLEQQHELALFCLVEALNNLADSCRVKILSTSSYLEHTLESMPSFIQRNYLENHRYEYLLKQLWAAMQQHQIEFLLQESNSTVLQDLEQQAKIKLQR